MQPESMKQFAAEAAKLEAVLQGFQDVFFPHKEERDLLAIIRIAYYLYDKDRLHFRGLSELKISVAHEFILERNKLPWFLELVHLHLIRPST